MIIEAQVRCDCGALSDVTYFPISNPHKVYTCWHCGLKFTLVEKHELSMEYYTESED